MQKIELEIYDNLVEAISKIANSADSEIELVFPQGSVLFENLLNLRILKAEAERLSKNISFISNDPAGIVLISKLDGLDDVVIEDSKNLEMQSVSKSGFKLPNISFPSLNFGSFKGFKLIFSIILALVLAAFVAAGYLYIQRVPKATVSIVVNSQPLIRSIEMSVVKDASNSSAKKEIKGISNSSTYTKTLVKPTTGTKLVGKKAKGEIKIFNRTVEEVSLEDGHEVYFDDYTFVLLDDVTIPPATEEDPEVIGSPLIPGEATVKVESLEIGSSQNIDKDEEITIDDYKKSQLVAKSTKDFSGGSAENINVVSQTDLDNIRAELLQEITQESEESLLGKSLGDTKMIPGSFVTTVISEVYSAKLNDETDEIELEMTVQSVGLSYSIKDVERVMEELVSDFIPDGFELSDKDSEINIEILGNSETTVLSSTRADLQVTLKTFVVTQVDEEKLTEQLAGKSLVEAQKILGGIRNIKTYSLNIDPSIPFFRKLPSSSSNVSIEIIRE